MPLIFRRVRNELWITLVFSGLFVVSAVAQTAPATKQVPAGTTATISPAPGAAPVKPTTPQGKMLDAALTPETRHTLQQAMESAPAPK